MGTCTCFFPFSTGGHTEQSETTKVPSRGKAPLRMRQQSLAALFWAVRAQQGGFSENCPAFSRPRAVWQLPRLWALKGGGPLFRLRARQEARGAAFPSAARASHAAPAAERDSRVDASGLYAETQKTLKFTKDMHGVRFDAYIKSENLWAEIGRRVPRAKALHS